LTKNKRTLSSLKRKVVKNHDDSDKSQDDKKGEDDADDQFRGKHFKKKNMS